MKENKYVELVNDIIFPFCFQENYKNAESLRKQLEIEIREITVRLEEAEAFAQREGKRMVAKLQARVSLLNVTWVVLNSFL